MRVTDAFTPNAVGAYASRRSPPSPCQAGETKMSNRALTRSRAADKGCRIFPEDSQDKAL